MTTIDRTTATDTEFAERIAAFDGATVPPEVLCWQVAEAMYEKSLNSAVEAWGDLADNRRAQFASYADAALAVVAQQPHPAMQRVEVVLAELEAHRVELMGDGDDFAGARGLGVGEAVDDVRAALAGDPR